MQKVDRAWNFYGSAANESNLKPLCQEVESHFVFPEKRLCRHFAIHEDETLNKMGKYYRGFHAPISSRSNLPIYLLHSFFRPYEEISINDPFEETIAFDNLVYIRDTTCKEGGIGFVTTYAHELQHFIQYGFTPKLSQVNFVLYENLKLYEPNAIATDIPHEREANIVSKRIAEQMFGIAAVETYAENQILFMEEEGEKEQRDRWLFFRNVPSSINYDLVRETLPFIEKYKNVLNFGVDVTQPEWWIG